MGRRPLPDTVKAKRGTLRESRRQPTDESVTTELTSVNVPSHLKGEAKKIFERLVRQCFSMKILAEIDTDALAIYAFEYAELIRLQQQLKNEGYVIEQETKSGTIMVANPLDRIVTKKIATVNAIGSQFGWSPVSRLKLLQIAQGEDKKNDFYDLINGKD